MRKALISLTLSLVACAPLAVLASPVGYDAVGDFSTVSNPNGPWSYGYGTTTSFTAYSVSGADWSGGGYAYWSGSADGLPVVGHNTSNNPGSGGLTTVYVPPTELWLHPGPAASGDDTIVRFTAPTTGFYDLASEFTRDNKDDNGNGVVVTILKGSTVLGTDVMPFSVGSTYDYNNASIFLTAGEILTFDLNNNGNYNSDSTGFEATLDFTPPSPVPEPSALMLFGTGIMGIAGAARRRFKA